LPVTEVPPALTDRLHLPGWLKLGHDFSPIGHQNALSSRTRRRYSLSLFLRSRTPTVFIGGIVATCGYIVNELKLPRTAGPTLGQPIDAKASTQLRPSFHRFRREEGPVQYGYVAALKCAVN